MSAGIARKGGKSVMGRRTRNEGGGIEGIGKEGRNSEGKRRDRLSGGSARNGLKELKGWERGERITKEKGRMVGGKVGFGSIQLEAVGKSKDNGYKEVLYGFDEKNLSGRELGKGVILPSPIRNGKEMAGMG